MTERARPTATGRLMLAGGVLGFTLGGFFDGVLLHQVLQWHHFLSLVPGEALRDVRVQILWDGLFHWIIGIRRVRVDVPDPLVWDVGWLVVTGLPPLLAAWRLGRVPGRDDPPGRGGAVAMMLALIVLAAGPIAARPPSDVTTVLVLFRPGLGAAAADGRMIWADERGELVAVDLGPSGSAWQLYRHGALLVGSSPVGGRLPRLVEARGVSPARAPGWGRSRRSGGSY